MTEPVTFTVHGRVGLATVDHPPVNALSQSVRAGLVAALDRLAADRELHALVIVCAGKTFFSGADIKEFGKPLLPPFLGEVIERLESSPKPTIAAIHGKSPRIHDSAFIAPGCRIIGDVEIGPDASIWYNCVIRADVNRVVIGARSNVQDGSVIHCDSPRPSAPAGWSTIIGEDVLVGHMAMLHVCTLEDRAFVGLGAIVMDGCAIESDAMLAAGAMLTSGKRVPAGQLWSGRPAAYMRDLPRSAGESGAAHYVRLAHGHMAEIAALGRTDDGPAQG